MRPGAFGADSGTNLHPLKEMGLLLTSAALFFLAFPSSLFPWGIGCLGFVALLPFFLLCNRTRVLRLPGIGLLAGFLIYLSFNYWLGAYHPLASHRIQPIPVPPAGQVQFGYGNLGHQRPGDLSCCLVGLVAGGCRPAGGATGWSRSAGGPPGHISATARTGIPGRRMLRCFGKCNPQAANSWFALDCSDGRRRDLGKSQSGRRPA